MNLTDINKFFKEEIPASVLKSIIAQEVQNYTLNLQKLGFSAEVYLIEDMDFYFGKSKLKKLCSVFLDSLLSVDEIAYIADAILLSNSVTFENEEIRDILETFTDPAIQGKLSQHYVISLLSQIED
ncbi:MAG: hypothetical protein H0W75_03185 [Chitinophagaceae bacterium]|nr:hypothetical protein [Chitinophagaceae bacterium]